MLAWVGNRRHPGIREETLTAAVFFLYDESIRIKIGEGEKSKQRFFYEAVRSDELVIRTERSHT